MSYPPQSSTSLPFLTWIAVFARQTIAVIMTNILSILICIINNLSNDGFAQYFTQSQEANHILKKTNIFFTTSFLWIMTEQILQQAIQQKILPFPNTESKSSITNLRYIEKMIILLFVAILFHIVIKMAEKVQVVAQQKKVYTYEDLIKFSNTDIYSGFGQVKPSPKPSAPQFSFGTSKRDSAPKRYFNKDLIVMDRVGKQAVKGPNYNVADRFSYAKDAEWKIGTTIRNTLDTKAKYQHYFRKDVDLDINEADRGIRNFNGNTRFGGDSRFPTDQKKYKMTPGPQYAPNLKPEIPLQPKYSLYSRRAVKGFDPLIELVSTTEIVGPGSYHPEKSAYTTDDNRPHWSIPKGPRDPSHKNRWQLNQTYDTTSAVGIQQRSDKTSKPIYSVGKQRRGQSKTGFFSCHMQYKPSSVRIDHPRF